MTRLPRLPHRHGAVPLGLLLLLAIAPGARDADAESPASRAEAPPMQVGNRDERVSASIGGQEKYLSTVVAAGGRWFAASPRAFFASADGRSFGACVEFSMPLAPLGIGATGDSVWTWSRSEFVRGTSRLVVRLPATVGAKPVALEMPILVDSGICVGDTACFLGSKVPGRGAPLFLAWTKDNGTTWSELALPVRRMDDGPALAHGPLGYFALGRDRQDQATLVGSPDLRTLTESALPPPVNGSNVKYRSIAAVGRSVAILGRVEYGSLAPHADFLLTGVAGPAATDASSPGFDWECCGVPLQPFTNARSPGKSELFSNDGVAMLWTGGCFLATRDLRAWFDVPALSTSRLTDWGSIAPFPREGVVFLTSVPFPGNELKESYLARAPLPTEDECRGLVPHRLFRIDYRPCDSLDRWEFAIVEWDKAMSLADLENGGGLDARIKATDAFLQRWKASKRGRLGDGDIAMATNALLRLLSRSASERTLSAIVLLSGHLDDGDRADGLARVCARLRSGTLGKLAELLEDMAAGMKGAKRRYGAVEPVIAEIGSPRTPAEFDVDLMRARTMRGDAGAARDLMDAYDRGAGVPVDVAASEFWGSEAGRLGLETRRGPEDLERSAEAGSTIALIELAARLGRADGPEPDREAARAYLRRAADRGSSLAMCYLADSLQWETGTPHDLREARDLLERAVRAGNPLAMRMLGVTYARGIGVTRNQRIAAAFFVQAALRQDTPSMLENAIRLACGLGVERNMAAAEAQLDSLARVQQSRSSWDPSKPIDVTAAKTQLPNANASALDDRYVPPQVAEPHVDLDRTLQAARGGDAVACADLATAHALGLGVHPSGAAASWWKQRAIALGWDAAGNVEPKSGRRTTPHSVLPKDGFKGDYMAYLREGAAAGGIRFKSALGAAILAEADASTEARETAVGLLLESAAAGSGEAWLRLATVAGRPESRGLVRRSPVECMEAAGENHEPRGYVLAAMFLLGDASIDDQKRVRAAEGLLRAARVEPPAGIDRRREPAAFVASAERALESAAAAGNADAMIALAAMLAYDMPARGRDLGRSELWAHAGRSMGSELLSIATFRTLPGWGTSRPAELSELEALQFSAGIREAMNAESNDLRLAGRRARSTPTDSRWAKAYAALMDQSLDDALIDDAARSSEVFTPRYTYIVPVDELDGAIRTLRARAKAHPNRRGLELVAAAVGVADAGIAAAAAAEAAGRGAVGFELSPLESAIIGRLGEEDPGGPGTPEDIALHEQVVKLLAARRYYGIGTAVDKPLAALIMLRSREPQTIEEDLGAVLADIDGASMARLAASLRP